MANCPNCNTKLDGGGLFSSLPAKIVSEIGIEAINLFLQTNHSQGCTKCLRKEILDTKSIIEANLTNGSKDFSKNKCWLPLTSSGVSSNWKFEVIDLVTAQANIGTGVVSELSSDIKDLFGMQSNTYNLKMSKAEAMCKNRLIMNGLALGANAIIGIDIDYNEVGGGKGMLMVSMTGTAISLKDKSVLSSDSEHRLEIAIESFQELNQLKAYDNSLAELLKVA